MSKESSIKVFAENASGTRPANAIPVWIDNISAIGGGSGGGSGNPQVESYVTTNSGKIDDVCTTVQTNSAQWAEGGSSDTFYIYPGKTTDKEISENSGKNLKLYNSANNVFLDFAGKSTLSNYTMFSFKEITGTQYNQNTLQHLRLRVYPNATSACKVYDTNTINLLDSNSTVSQANTAYYDAGGYSLTQTRMNFDTLNSFVQSNSASWGQGGSSPAGEGVLFHKYYSYDPIDGNPTEKSFVSGATEFYFEASCDRQGHPNDLLISHNGDEIVTAYWSQVSSDGSNNYFTASYINSDGGEVGLLYYGYTLNYCYVSANGVKTQAFSQGQYECSTDKTVKFNINGYNFRGYIEGWSKGGNTQITSFTGGLTDFTAKGYERYNVRVDYDDGNYSYNYDLSAEFGAGGSTVASGDVFPPTNNLDPYATYYLGWNANNGGLQWFYQGGNGN